MSDINEANAAGVALAELLRSARSEDPIVAADAAGGAVELAHAMLEGLIIELQQIATAESTTAEKKKARAAAFAKFHHEEPLAALALLHRQRWAALQTISLRLRAVDGVAKGEIDNLLRAAASCAERSEDAPSRSGTPLHQLLRDLDPSLRLLAPPGYRVDAGGIVVDDEEITQAPIVIRRVAKALDSGRVRWTVAWQHLGAWAEETIDRATACDSRALVAALAGRGAPVNSANSGPVVRYLAQFEAFNARGLQPADTVSRLGWHGDRFVAGSSDEIEVRLRVAKPAGWTVSGTREGWLRAWDLASRHEVAALCVYLCATAPLLRFLRLGYCPIVDLFGPSGVGKTTSVFVGLSLFGVPNLEDEGGIGAMWGGSVSGREERAADLWDVPMVLDDTNKVGGRDPARVVGDALYHFHRGRSRDLKSTYGEPLYWRNILISTGEKPAAGATEAGGAKNRVLSVDASNALPSREVARAIEAAIRDDYGHLGREIAAAALQLGPERLQALHRGAEDGWAATVSCDTRLLSTAALVSVAHHVLHEVIGLPHPHVDPLDEEGLLLRSLRASAVEADQGERALELIRAELAMHGGQYRPAKAVLAAEPPGGWRGIWDLDMGGDRVVVMFAPILHRLLAQAGHDRDPVCRRWRAAGVLGHCNHGHQLRTRRDGRNVEGYAFALDRVT